MSTFLRLPLPIFIGFQLQVGLRVAVLLNQTPGYALANVLLRCIRAKNVGVNVTTNLARGNKKYSGLALGGHDLW